jgi:hypothetical protein
LCGPIDRCPNGGTEWRTHITPLLKSNGVIVLDPLNKPFNVGLENDDYREDRAIWKKNHEFEKFSLVMKTVRHVDLKMVRMSDFLIAYIDLDIFACGTMEEIFTANAENKPVIILCPQGKEKVPDWFFGTLPHEMFFESVDEVMDYLAYVNDAPYINTHNRWCIPDFDMLYDDAVLG